ncbi:MAG: ankyrin repeat domain-containing protein [Acidobacteria bacterium]|nr:ankyrin repeat domain-containing protein [Acidobacteriota bacterium]
MTLRPTRRQALLAVPAAPALAQTAAPAPAQQDTNLVKDWVAKAHQRKLDPMRALLKQSPELIHSSYDWGAGDWEGALQAAAHTGSHDMARFLLDSGARLDLLAAAMLGELAFVKLSLQLLPNSIRLRGAHGIPLLSHAVAGAEPAAPVFEFLLDSGADVNTVHNNGMTPIALAVQTGRRDAVRRLLAKGANPGIRAKNGATPLSLALKLGDPGIIADLKAAGATE